MNFQQRNLAFRALTVFCVLGLTATSVKAAPLVEQELKVGVVQRFGDEATEELLIESLPGDRLTLNFTTGTKPQTLQTKSVKLEIAMQSLPKPELAERVVLGVFRSFETAEESAQRWKAQGIEVEVAQPERWEVWAKRDVYNTPLLRRLLMGSLQTKGNKTAYLDSKVVEQSPKLSWIVGGNRYSRDKLDISATKNLIQVSQAKNKSDTTSYPGRLRLQGNAYGSYTLINHVPIESYLRGVVPNEIGAKAPYNAVEAQTIIARTYALRNVRRFAIDGYELSADVHCQVYKGLSGIDPNSDRAISATKGQVLTYNNQLVDALYSSTTGGVTAKFSDVWNGQDRPYLKPVVDSAASVWNLARQSLADEQNFQQFININRGFNEVGWKTFRWRRESSIEQLTTDLQKYLEVNRSPFASFQKLNSLKVVERSPGGRILKLSVQTDMGTFNLLKDEVRSAFSAPRSTLFYLEPVKKDNNPLWGYAFVGGGFGHGVGLSQTGSYRLADLGWTSKRILNFYYPGTTIQVLDPIVKS
ncbi:SpoIID/LytB domain-containing protein [Synechocystis sp. PCC 7509]|uniref:SpoIID/LytB domain-containing protein n=1 Tax=Synechocystis sp. PCC 7509 TaxID=927677 RepID=UPI0002ABC57E|nr:SpoIID/LytB domain-containing protein [Synechocystis sp. PCC 7509]